MKYRLNMTPNKVRPFVYISQYDEGRDITFALYEDEEPYIPTSAIVNIGSQSYEGVISGNEVTITVGEEISQEAGYMFGEVVDYNNGRIGSCNFRLRIDSTPMVVPNTENGTLSRALSIVFGRNVTENSSDAWNILTRGE